LNEPRRVPHQACFKKGNAGTVHGLCTRVHGRKQGRKASLQLKKATGWRYGVSPTVALKIAGTIRFCTNNHRITHLRTRNTRFCWFVFHDTKCLIHQKARPIGHIHPTPPRPVWFSPQTICCSGPPCRFWFYFKPSSSCSRLRSALHHTAAAVILLATPLCAARRCLLALFRPTKRFVWFLLECLQHLCMSCCASSAGLACQVCRALAVSPVCCSVSFYRSREQELSRLAGLIPTLFPLGLPVFLT
jgi:hypothetical protein